VRVQSARHQQARYRRGLNRSDAIDARHNAERSVPLRDHPRTQQIRARRTREEPGHLLGYQPHHHVMPQSAKGSGRADDDLNVMLSAGAACPRLNTHWPTQSTSTTCGNRVMGRSYQRCTLVIGEVSSL